MFGYHFKQKDISQSEELLKECIQLILAIRLLATVQGALRLNETNRILRIKKIRPYFYSGIKMEYDDFTGTLSIKSENPICNDRDYLKHGYLLLMEYFTKYFTILKSMCIPAKLETISQRFADYSVLGGESSLDMYLDDQELVKLDLLLKSARDTNRQREILNKKKIIYEKYKDGTSIFSDDAKMFLSNYAKVNQALSLTETIWDRKRYDTLYCTIRSWGSISKMIKTLRSYSSMHFLYKQSIWEEIGYANTIDFEAVKNAQIQTILIAKILLTSLANKTIENGYIFCFKLFPDIDNEWDFATNAKYEIITTTESCTIFTNKLKYIDETNTYSHTLTKYPDKQYINSLLEACGHSIDYVIRWLSGQNNYLYLASLFKAIAAED